jgi:integrase
MPDRSSSCGNRTRSDRISSSSRWRSRQGHSRWVPGESSEETPPRGPSSWISRGEQAAAGNTPEAGSAHGRKLSGTSGGSSPADGHCRKKPVAAFTTRWLEALTGTVAATTWTAYESKLRLYVIPELGDALVSDVSPVDLNALYSKLHARGLSPRTIRHAHVVAHRMFGDAVRWQLIGRNPVDLASPPSAPPRGHETWTPNELAAFLKHVREDRLYAAWLLLATTGMRRGEALGLRWSDIRLDAAVLEVTRNLTMASSTVIETSPKTRRGRRSIALDRSTVAALREHRVGQLEERIAFGAGYEDAGRVFCWEDGRQLRPDWFTRRFQQLARTTGLEPIGPHGLRHTWATLALRSGVHPKVVSERLGHASITITLDTYSHAIPEMQAEAAQQIADLIGL